MIIKTGDKTITVRSVYRDQATIDGAQYPTLRVETKQPLTLAELAALQSDAWGLYINDALEGTHEGYNTIVTCRYVFARVQSKDAEIAQLTAKVAALESENAAMRQLSEVKKEA